MTRLGTLLGLGVLLTCPACASLKPMPVSAQTDEAQLPALTGRVVDGADLLPAEREAQITTKLAALEARRTDELIVVTLPSLGSASIEQVGLRLGNAWGVGQSGKDNGVLLIVAPNDRRTRIEVGIGLEPHLTNAEAAIIIDTVLLPAFRSGAFAAGIDAGVDAIIAELDRSPLVRARS